MVSDYSSTSLYREHNAIGANSEIYDPSLGTSETVYQIGETTLTVSSVDPSHQLLMVYEIDGQKTSLEFIVSIEENGKYLTSIFINGELRYCQNLDGNLLEPKSIISPNKVSQTASVERFSGITSSYTYIWWDGIKQVTGPSYLIKYHHPDRTYYQIGKFQTVVLTGYNALHTQLSQSVSAGLVIAGWPVLFGAIGTAFGGVAGALLGAVLGVLFAFISGEIAADEEGCIWYWFGSQFANWFAANAWWLATNPFGWGATVGAFLQIGYLKVGTVLLQDGPGLGSP